MLELRQDFAGKDVKGHVFICWSAHTCSTKTMSII